MSSAVDLPSIQTKLCPYSTSTEPSRPRRSVSPDLTSPSMTFQNRFYSSSSASSYLSTYSLSSDRSLPTSPGPATPCDMTSQSPSFSHESIYKPSLYNSQHKHPLFSSYTSSPSPPLISSPQRYTTSLSPISSFRHRPHQSYHHSHQQQKRYSQASCQERPFPSSSRDLPNPSCPRDMLPNRPLHGHSDYRLSYHHHPQHQGYQQRLSYSTSANNSSNNHHQIDHFQVLLPPGASYNPSLTHHTAARTMITTLKEEEQEPSVHMRSITPPCMARSSHDHSTVSSAEDDRSDYYPSISRSPSFSRDSSPTVSSDSIGSMSEASASMISLISSSSSSSTSTPMVPISTTTQSLLCPVCSRAFKPSKNQNCNLRRHLKNVHNMSPTIHPRKCKWDSLPDGRVKDDKDRKERTRKSKRLWARKFRLRRKVEEAAVVLSMLSQAV
ncbi:hypothetical protein BX616_004494 [Lobosporangium transversale]|uniref:Uncharacterized protein n=1 Tax=Lobosporangium transversale TaxID=64571 RepID=A0A1Y2GLV1_9FUNG|nr:hypothetical protein BCR41DRAFT_397330 [Lobosporangium transversale]KAF9898099.1 hypothetical protein BX616_004494 [Lobosporangium transversale]ORZ12905.1 hypothetical protein BCR41DRAFT_397330 [Lobosporangium transversale]|eukprot:XP_021880254.1 hypothetical protein BCR41DRAFT_397330 [Lobosporangium transversale]